MRKAISIVTSLLLSACGAPQTQAWPIIPGSYASSSLPGGGGGGGGGGGYVLANYADASCEQPPTAWGGTGTGGGGTTYYVDPGASGNNGNSGLVGHPVKDLATGVGKLSSSGGDTLILEGGSYGAAFTVQNKVNSGWNRIMADTGQTPVFTSFNMDGSQRWLIQGVKIQNNPGFNFDTMGTIAKGTSGAHNIVLDKLNFSTVDDASSWTQAQLANLEYYGLSVTEAAENDGTVTCIGINRPLFLWVRNSLSLVGNYLLVQDGEFSNLTGDNIDYAGHYGAILRNYSHDEHALGVSNHNDFLQIPVSDCPQTPYCTRGPVLIDGNKVHERESSATTLSTENTDEALDCIVSWDQAITGATVTNNDCVTSSSNVMTFGTIYNSTIANNTSVNHYANGAGIEVDLQGNANISGAGAANSHDVHVFNNIGSNVSWPSGTNLTGDHNLVLSGGTLGQAGSSHTGAGTYTTDVITSQNNAQVFATYNFSTRSFDVHLLAGSDGIGIGTATGAPNKADGTARTAPVDAGGY